MDEDTPAVATALQAVRDHLLAQLGALDQLGERMAAIEVSSAIEILNERIGDPTGQPELDRLARRFFGN